MSVQVTLANNELWDEFHLRTTEMIVTKTGRKMFPKLEYSIEGLEPDQLYAIALEIKQVDDCRYKFSGGEWAAAGRGEMSGAARPVAHHDGAVRGAQWMKAPVQFERLKITNNPTDTNPSHVYLNSMHKYVPVMSVYLLNTIQHSPFMVAAASSHKLVAQIRLESTEFIAVTAYQNDRIKQLKIEHNPFAKGFRDGGERKRSSPDSSGSSGPSPKRQSLLPTDLPTSPFASPTALLPMINPLWYSGYWNPYLINPLLAQYRFGFPKQD